MSRSPKQSRSRKQPVVVRQRRRNQWVSVAVVVGLVVAGLLGWGIYQSQRGGDVPTPAHASAAGSGLVDGDGPVTVEIWLDLHCPHCRTFEQQAGATLDQLVAEGAITRVHYPVAFLDRFSTTDYSTRAAASVGCAADGDAHVAYLQALLAAQPPPDGPGLSDGQLAEVAASVGLTGPGFGGCVDDGRYRGWVEEVTAAATKAGVTSTPTVRVDGTDVEPSAAAIATAVRAAEPRTGS